jgi:hypothetical protein
MKAGLSHEEELLVLCASPMRDDIRSARIAYLRRQPLDWDRLDDLASYHRLAPLLHWELKTLDAGFQENLKNSLLLTRELVRVIDLLESKEIPALPFKGPTLALAAYHNLALRSFCDLDILVTREDVWRVRDLLQSIGYTAKVPVKPGLESAFLHSYDELVMYGPGNETLLEIHWAFVPPHFSFDLDFLNCWERRVQIPLANRTLPALHPEDLLLVLCVHGSKHCWSHLGLVCDIAWLLTSQPVDLPPLLERARSLGVQRMLLLALALASRIFNIPVQPQPDNAVAPLVDEIVAALFGRHHDQTSIRENASLHMRMRERRRDRWRYFLQLATRPGIEDWEMVNLPKSLNFLYSLLRYPRLVAKYAAKCAARIIK